MVYQVCLITTITFVKPEFYCQNAEKEHDEKGIFPWFLLVRVTSLRLTCSLLHLTREQTFMSKLD